MPAYEIRESTRAKHVRVDVYPDGRVVVTKPARVSEEKAIQFMVSRKKWIEEVVAKFERRKARTERARQKAGLVQLDPLPRLRRGTHAYAQAVKEARAFVVQRLEHFNSHYNFKYGSVSIRNQKTRWGSCSTRGNLSFNYKIIFLPPALQDYLIVHELCHVREHNHSAKFWALVSEQISKYTHLRTVLKNIR